MDRSCCILEDDSEPYEDIGWLVAQIQKMPALPDAFICANDYHAVHILSALKRLGKQVPADVMVTGFDDAPQSDVVEPALSTVRIPNGDLGRIAANVMLERIEQPELPCRRIYLKTTPSASLSQPGIRPYTCPSRVPHLPPRFPFRQKRTLPVVPAGSSSHFFCFTTGPGSPSVRFRPVQCNCSANSAALPVPELRAI